MKLFFLGLFALVSLNVFAHDLCKLQTTNDLDAAVKLKQIKIVKEVTNFYAFNHLEKGMIHLTVSAVHFDKVQNQAEALKIFGDFHPYTGGKPGSLAGEIIYLTRGNLQFAFVRYWPGDNEYGAFVTIINNRLTILATIHDGEIVCR